MAIGKTPEEKQKILDAWKAAEAQGTSMAAWVDSVKGDTHLKVSIGTLRNWLGLNAPRAGGSGGSSKSRATSASSRTALSLEAEFEAQYAAERDQKLLAFLEAKVQELDTQLKVAQGAVRDQKVKMGLLDPPISE